MRELLFITLIAFAFIYFVYEGILAPSLRAKLRLDLFALRDELRDLKIEHRAELSDEVFRELQTAINGAVTRLNQIDLRLLRNTRLAFQNDEKLRKRVARRIAILEACSVEEVRVIRDKYSDLLDNALIINTAGCIPYLVPVFFGFLFAESAKTLIQKAFSLSENDLNRIAPPPAFA